jgi:hypothetical protein
MKKWMYLVVLAGCIGFLLCMYMLNTPTEDWLSFLPR